MKYLVVTFIITFFQAQSGWAQKGKSYPVSDIPDQLKTNVDVVVREDLKRYEILSQSSATLRVLHAVTILSEQGNRYALKSIGYDKNTKIKDFNATVYDAEGTQIKRLKNSEIYDHIAFDGVSFLSDNRVKSVSLVQATYPYTVVFDYEIEYNYLYHIPGSNFISAERMSVQHAAYEIIYPKALAPRYKVIGIQDVVKKSVLPDGRESMQWDYSSILPVEIEPFGPYLEEFLPRLMFAPSSFTYEGYSGDMSSWKSYGKWNALLNKGRDELPIEVKQKVAELIKGARTDEQKAKVLYSYLQSKTRYVGIQLGIGGLQPFYAKDVDQTGYGDCKALSNYMIALLKEAGIKGYYTTIQAGEGEPDVMLDFPSHQANHVIVSVPMQKDTLWLECTSQTSPFGYLGKFTEDRYAMMITDEGGKMVRTPRYTPEQNQQFRTALLNVDEKGNATAQIKTTYRGIQYENEGINHAALQHTDEQKKWINDHVDIPAFQLNSFAMTTSSDKIPSVVLSLDLKLDRYASVSGKRIFVSPNLMNKMTYTPDKVENRKMEVFKRTNYIDRDTVRIKIPESIYPEFMPKPLTIKSRFGEYSATFEFLNGEVIYVRSMKSWKGKYPKEAYQELVDFYKSVNKADNIKLVFLTKT